MGAIGCLTVLESAYIIPVVWDVAFFGRSELTMGDLVLSYWDGQIRAYGVTCNLGVIRCERRFGIGTPKGLPRPRCTKIASDFQPDLLISVGHEL